jgi:5-(carboxyamino)imidazole ribonucleotide mutase
MNASSDTPLVGIVMGSATDWNIMQRTTKTLAEFDVAYEARVLSAHRTPDETAEWARSAEERGLRVLIAAAGGAAHLAGVVAAHTLLPVLGVPMQAWSLDGLDSLLAMAQMPRGIPVATLAIGSAGATNAALLAIEILALSDPDLRQKLTEFRAAQAHDILNTTLE